MRLFEIRIIADGMPCQFFNLLSKDLLGPRKRPHAPYEQLIEHYHELSESEKFRLKYMVDQLLTEEEVNELRNALEEQGEKGQLQVTEVALPIIIPEPL